MAHILAEETFDAFVKFLDAVDVLLLHPIGTVGFSRFWGEWADTFIDFIVPGNIGDKVPHMGKTLHRFDAHRFIKGQLIHTCHAHQFRFSIHLGAA